MSMMECEKCGMPFGFGCHCDVKVVACDLTREQFLEKENIELKARLAKWEKQDPVAYKDLTYGNLHHINYRRSNLRLKDPAINTAHGLNITYYITYPRTNDND
jgi:hypothetical protein